MTSDIVSFVVRIKERSEETKEEGAKDGAGRERVKNQMTCTMREGLPIPSDQQSQAPAISQGVQIRPFFRKPEKIPRERPQGHSSLVCKKFNFRK
jgi:hypothetical protein